MDPQVAKLIELLSDPKYAMVYLLLAIWALAWKGVAIWKAVTNRQRNWFIALLITNTFGILEIIYIFYFQKREGEKLDEKK